MPSPGRSWSPADADDRVDVVRCGGFAGAGGHVDRDVHHHVVVAEQDAQVRGDAVGDVRFLLGRDNLTRLAPRAATSCSRRAAASPEPKLTRCGRVSWTKRMLSIFPLPAEDAHHAVFSAPS